MESDKNDETHKNSDQSEKTNQPPSKKHSSKGLRIVLKILLITFIVALLAGGSFLIAQKVLLPRYQTYQIKKELTTATKPVKKKPKAQPGIIYTISDLTVNTYGSLGRRFLVAEYALETSDKEVVDELKNREPQVRDMLIKYLRNFSAEDILNMNFQEDSRKELIKLINSCLTSGTLDSLYYTTLVVQ
jgi:flagellar basal body-associated protein FliL